MEKTREYRRTLFPPEVIRKAFAALEQAVLQNKSWWGRDEPPKARVTILTVERKGEEWNFDAEDEFFADYRTEHLGSSFVKEIGNSTLNVHFGPFGRTRVGVRCPARVGINAAFEVFEENLEASRITDRKKFGLDEMLADEDEDEEEEQVKVFIGHGRSNLWRELKDHLSDKHKYDIEAYEVGSRSGHAVRDILESMMDESTIAFLVLTGENLDPDGKLHARENVIHETGLFQGKLGFDRAIVLLEEGCEEFSNIQGIEQIRFHKGNIKETFGDVLAVLRREFG